VLRLPVLERIPAVPEVGVFYLPCRLAYEFYEGAAARLRYGIESCAAVITVEFVGTIPNESENVQCVQLTLQGTRKMLAVGTRRKSSNP
jgi:hypothetical protein